MAINRSLPFASVIEVSLEPLSAFSCLPFYQEGTASTAEFHALSSGHIHPRSSRCITAYTYPISNNRRYEFFLPYCLEQDMCHMPCARSSFFHQQKIKNVKFCPILQPEFNKTGDRNKRWWLCIRCKHNTAPSGIHQTSDSEVFDSSKLKVRYHGKQESSNKSRYDQHCVVYAENTGRVHREWIVP